MAWRMEAADGRIPFCFKGYSNLETPHCMNMESASAMRLVGAVNQMI